MHKNIKKQPPEGEGITCENTQSDNTEVKKG